MLDVPIHIVADFQLSQMSHSFASLIKIADANPSQKYQDLACTEKDQSVIHEIITTMAENGKLYLLMKKSYMHGLGEQINHVHPLKFLSTILTHPHLKECLYGIFDDYFKRNGFMDGIGGSLTREAEKNKLTQYIDGFAKEVGTTKDQIQSFFDQKDWEALVRHFLES